LKLAMRAADGPRSDDTNEKHSLIYRATLSMTFINYFDY
jgi:hypothetical protein